MMKGDESYAGACSSYVLKKIVAEVGASLATIPPRIRGVRIVEEPPVLRHFTAHFEPAHQRLIMPE